jgi:hypothetical protein
MAAPARLLLAALLVFAGLAGCSAVQGQVIKRYDADIRQQGGLSAPRTEQLAGDDVVVIDRERGEEPVLLLHGFGGEKASAWSRPTCRPLGTRRRRRAATTR